MTNTDAQPLIPFNDLSRGTAVLRTEIDGAISRVLSSGWYVLGPEHDSFESELGLYVGVDHTIIVGNGTDALQLALAGLEVEAGDAVITAANAGGYTSTAVRSLGAVPVYAEVDKDSHLVTVDTLESALRSSSIVPKVVVVTHLFGAAADMVAIMSWARLNNILVIEDCAQSLGATVGGRRAGSFGDAATTSFYPTKNLGALGDGGAVFAANEAVARRIRQLRQYGWESKYRTTISGGRNSRLDELQAAILRIKLPLLDGWNERRRHIHSRYEAAASANVRFVNSSSPAFVGHLAVFETVDRDAVRKRLREVGIATDVHYPVPDHVQPLLDGSYRPSLAVTETLAQSIVSIPLFPELTETEVDRVSAALERV